MQKKNILFAKISDFRKVRAKIPRIGAMVRLQIIALCQKSPYTTKISEIPRQLPC